MAVPTSTRFVAVIAVIACASLGAASGLESTLNISRTLNISLNIHVTRLRSTQEQCPSSALICPGACENKPDAAALADAKKEAATAKEEMVKAKKEAAAALAGAKKEAERAKEMGESRSSRRRSNRSRSRRRRSNRSRSRRRSNRSRSSRRRSNRSRSRSSRSRSSKRRSNRSNRSRSSPAKCRASKGALDCLEHKSRECPDDLSQGKYLAFSKSGWQVCRGFDGNHALKGAAISVIRCRKSRRTCDPKALPPPDCGLRRRGRKGKCHCKIELGSCRAHIKGVVSKVTESRTASKLNS